MGCDAQLAEQLYEMTYKPSKLGHTDLVLVYDQRSSVGFFARRTTSLYMQRL